MRVPKNMPKKLTLVIASGEGESEDLWWEEDFSLYYFPSVRISILNTRLNSCLYCYIQHVSIEQRQTSAMILHKI